MHEFPAEVTGPTQNWEQTRALSDGEIFWVFAVEANEVALVATGAVTNLVQLETGARPKWAITDSDGNVWTVIGGGGCACGSAIKRYGLNSLFELAGVA